MKKLKWIALIVVVLIVVAVGIVILSIDGILRSVVQSQASSSLNLPTTLGGVHLSLLGGKVSISDLAVGSPQGFSAPQMLSLGSAGVAVSYGELRGNPIHIDTVALDRPKLVLEQSGGKFNIDALMGQSSAPPPSDSKGGQTMKLIIDHLTVNGADVAIRPDLPGVPAEIPISIPGIDLKNIGNADGSSNGAAIKDVVVQIMQALEAKAAQSDQVPAPVRALLSGNLSALGGKARQELNQSIDAIKSGNPDAIKGAGKDAQNALGGLLGGKKQ